MITFCASQTSATQQDLFTRAAAGLRGIGVNAMMICNQQPETHYVACWGWRKGERLRQRGHDVLVFERGYLGDRFHWTSIAWNGLNGRGKFGVPWEVDSERFEKFYSMKPWNPDGEYIVIMGQVPGDMSLMGYDMTGYYEQIATRLAGIYGRPVFFRPHPVGRNFDPRIPVIGGTLDEVLANAFLVVAYNSNSTVDAVVNGIPAITLDAGGMARDVTGHNLSDRIMPDRTRWAARLAHCQWSPEEIDNGDYWKRMSSCAAAN